jgi:hypothetical protein
MQTAQRFSLLAGEKAAKLRDTSKELRTKKFLFAWRQPPSPVAWNMTLRLTGTWSRAQMLL